MADGAFQKRAPPPRERRESKRLRGSPVTRSTTPATATTATPAPATSKRHASTPTPAPASTRSDSKSRRANKKRPSVAATPTAPTAPTTPSNASSPAPTPEEVWPTKLSSTGPLPSSRTKQSSDLSKKDFQSIADSAVLAASLHRSRMQWLSEGIFKKYWVKPVKRKGVVEVPPGNPDVKSMQKMGNGTITIEPHKFDVTFYVVRDLQAPVPYYRSPNPPPPPPLPKPQVQLPYSAAATPRPKPASTPMLHHPYHPATPVNASPVTPAPQKLPLPVTIPGPSPGPVLTRVQAPASTPVPVPTPVPSPVSTAVPTAVPTPVPHPAPTTVPVPTQISQPPPVVVKREPIAPQSAFRQPVAPEPRPPPKTTADPVIQMLAARAASDPQLKDLMKVVATSQASLDQLREFQRHIDELNEVVRRQEAEREHQQKAKPPPPVVAPPATPGAASPAVPPRMPYNTAAPSPPAPAVSASGMPPSHYSPYPPQPRPEALIKHIVFEFHGDGSSSDRWLFPEHAVLDIRYGGLEMTVSFFVERKGGDIIKQYGSASDQERELLAAKWQAGTEYYQPVTMHVRANQHKTIETIARGAKTLPVVQEYMKKVMQDKTRAPTEYLMHQLPREKPVVDFVDSAVEMDSDDEDVLEDYYGN